MSKLATSLFTEGTALSLTVVPVASADASSLATFAAKSGAATTEQELIFLAAESSRVPSDIRRIVEQFRNGVLGADVLVLRGLHLGPLPPTPAHWSDAACGTSDAQLVLLASVLGDVFAWATQQDGRLVHNVLPVAGNENAQLGSNSESELTLHTEDAFNEFRADYVMLLCLRNPRGVPTRFGFARHVSLTDSERAMLAEEAYPILPDISHLPAENSAGAANFTAVMELQNRPSPVAILSSAPGGPVLRYDPYYGMPAITPKHDDALKALTAELQASGESFALMPGDLCVIDNHRVVHGRAPFRALYDGNDRWLKRVCVTKDINRSRAVRHSDNCLSVGCDGTCGR